MKRAARGRPWPGNERDYFVLGLGVEPMPLPLLDPEPRLPDAPVLESVEVPPAPLVVTPSSLRQRSFSRPVIALQRAEPALAPVDEEPPIALDEEPVLPLPLEPTEGVLRLPLPVAPVLPEVLPVVLPEVCANADIANSAAAVAETRSFRFMGMLLWMVGKLRLQGTQIACREWRLLQRGVFPQGAIP